MVGGGLGVGGGEGGEGRASDLICGFTSFVILLCLCKMLSVYSDRFSPKRRLQLLSCKLCFMCKYLCSIYILRFARLCSVVSIG